ncbi:LysR family transcriptional regulator [Psittacicella gerlachiana]|uniref:HTH lysR-type domain-containing protein n=1 Tax=Psittacicella gerlachiana TaxID=2028574 RepID=A0A3A1Y9P4_9GAMM|nr:LysR family transcriptional regulator [Psittacicella gerlachiana]RIY32837.1 hypothetical protein CKF59_06710 [Psittacicella gerlachiana]
MAKNFNDLYLYLVVVQSGGFTSAAKYLNITTSAVSHGITNLENRLKVKLLNRTTRSISCTEAGRKLYERLIPLYDSIEKEILELSNVNNEVRGTIRINASTNICRYLLYPRLKDLLQANPELNLEFYADFNFVDIVEQGFDFGVRLGEELAQDMIAVQISPPIKMHLVASPAYLAKHGTPKTLDELHQHTLACLSLNNKRQYINWEFMKNGNIVKPDLTYSLRSNTPELLKQAALDGTAMVWGFSYEYAAQIESGELVEVLSEFAPVYEPLYLYYPQNRHKSKAMQEVIEALRYKA